MNHIRQIWAAGEAAIIGWLNIPSILSAEALARCGYDGLLVDLQHGAIDMASVSAMLLAVEHGGAEPFARASANSPADIMRLLDFGATGIVAPMINCAADAHAFADALHYPPHGSRSYGPRRPQWRFGPNYLPNACACIFSLAMVETPLVSITLKKSSLSKVTTASSSARPTWRWPSASRRAPTTTT